MLFNIFGNRKSRKGDDESPKKSDTSHDFLFQMKVLAGIGCLLIGIYSFRLPVSSQILRIFGVGMLVAGAALLSGILLGFIFAIPRVSDRERDLKKEQEKRKTAVGQEGILPLNTGEQPYSVSRNGNLVEISDWLTKIIVGVGLVELHSILGKLGRMSYELAPALLPAGGVGGSPGAESLIIGQAAGLAILFFYFTLGFLLGYVWTMVYFQRDLEQENEQLSITLRKKNEELKHKNEGLNQKNEELEKARQISNLLLGIEGSISANRLDEAMATTDELLANDPKNGFFVMTKARIFKRQATERTGPDRDKLLKQAITYIDQAIALLPDKGEPLYNKACYQALLDPIGLKSEVLENLKSSFRFNPGLRKAAEDDNDLLDSFKQDSDFVDLIRKV
jgi:hypothetical protein